MVSKPGQRAYRASAIAQAQQRLGEWHGAAPLTQMEKDMQKVIENHYFKQSDYPLMSGLPLPTNAEGKVVEIKFVNCIFHPNCEGVDFVDCEFVNCDGDDYLTKYLSAPIPRGSEFEFCSDCGTHLQGKPAHVCGDVAVLCSACLIRLHKRTAHKEQNERLGLGYECKCTECELG